MNIRSVLFLLAILVAFTIVGLLGPEVVVLPAIVVVEEHLLQVRDCRERRVPGLEGHLQDDLP